MNIIGFSVQVTSKIFKEMLNNKLEKKVEPVFSNKRMSVDLLLRTEFESFLSYN